MSYIGSKRSSSLVSLDEGTIGDNVKFPAGHVIQVVTPPVTVETNSLTTSYVNYYEASLTLKSSNSKVFIVHSFNYFISSGGFGQQIYRSTSTPVTTSDTVVFNSGAVDGTGGPLQYFIGSTFYSTATTQAVDDISGQTAGDELYYGFFYKAYSGTVNLPVNESTDGFFATTIFEIQK
jgi:hypothetical protein